MARNNIIYPPTVNNFNTTLNGAISSSATTITLNSVTGLQNKAGILIIDRVDSAGNLTPSSEEWIYFNGVSGSSVTLPSAADGRGVGGSTAQSHADGAIVEAVFDVTIWGGMTTLIATQHNDNGTHTALTSDSLGLSSNASIAGSLFVNTQLSAGRSAFVSTASVGGILNTVVGVNMPSTASGYYQAGVPVAHLGADKLLRLSQIRTQNDNSNSITSITSEKIVIQAGWVQTDGGGAATAGETVNFPTAFTSVISIVVSPMGSKTSVGTDITDFLTDPLTVANAEDITTSSFFMRIRRHDGGNLTSGTFYASSWIAIGTIT